MNEVATLIQSAIQRSETDGTYSAGEFGSAMIKFIVAAIWLCAVTHRRGVLFVPGGGRQDDAPTPAAALLGGLDYVKTDVRFGAGAAATAASSAIS